MKEVRPPPFRVPSHDLLSVQFDDIEENDHQTLEFDRYKVEATVKKMKKHHSSSTKKGNPLKKVRKKQLRE